MGSIQTLDGTSDLTFQGVCYERYNAYHNPVPVVDYLNGRIYVFYNLSVTTSRILYRYSELRGRRTGVVAACA